MTLNCARNGAAVLYNATFGGIGQTQASFRSQATAPTASGGIAKYLQGRHTLSITLVEKHSARSRSLQCAGVTQSLRRLPLCPGACVAKARSAWGVTTGNPAADSGR